MSIERLLDIPSNVMKNEYKFELISGSFANRLSLAAIVDAILVISNQYIEEAVINPAETLQSTSSETYDSRGWISKIKYGS